MQVRAIAVIVLVLMASVSCADHPTTTYEGEEVFLVEVPECDDEAACAEEFLIAGDQFLPEGCADAPSRHAAVFAILEGPEVQRVYGKPPLLALEGSSAGGCAWRALRRLER